MKRFNNIEYNKVKKTLDVGAGVTWGDVYEYFERFSDHTPGVVGGDPVVGVSGWLLGGGYSTLTNLFGLGIDNVVGFRVLVPAKGICDVSRENNPEIFKALKVRSPYNTYYNRVLIFDCLGREARITLGLSPSLP